MLVADEQRPGVVALALVLLSEEEGKDGSEKSHGMMTMEPDRIKYYVYEATLVLPLTTYDNFSDSSTERRTIVDSSSDTQRKYQVR